MNLAVTNDLPSLPRESGEPVFREPWEAQVFSLALTLHARGCFTWKEWTEALSAEIGKDKDAVTDDGSHYYHRWYRALTHLVARKEIVSHADIVSREKEWEAAAQATPHGQPIKLMSR